MGLILKHVILTKAGTFHYRRRFSRETAAVLGKNEFKRLLGSTEREALKNFPKVNAEYERLVTSARQSQIIVPERTSSSTAIELHREALRRARVMAGEKVFVGDRELTGDDPEAADILRESLLSRVPIDSETGDPVGGDGVEGRAIGILASGGRIDRPAPTVEDANRLYLQERVTGDINETSKRNQLKLVMSHMVAASIRMSRTLSSLKRDDAREVRDYMLRDLNLSPASVRRYLNTISAVIALGRKEYDVEIGRNPFEDLTVKLEDIAVNDRHPIPNETLKAIRKRLEERAGGDLWKIWRILEGTGCRISEVTGLLVSDVHLD